MYRFNEVEPKYYNSIEEYRKEMLNNNSSFDGCSFLENYEDIEKWHLNNKLFERQETCPPGYAIGFTYLYLNDNDEVIGLVNLRPEIYNNPYLKQYGGHIGYSVKPSKRNKGIGKQMLKDFLPICKDKYKLDKVLITCLKNNIGSMKIITGNGGIFESEVFYAPCNETLQRYWLSLN